MTYKPIFKENCKDLPSAWSSVSDSDFFQFEWILYQQQQINIINETSQSSAYFVVDGVHVFQIVNKLQLNQVNTLTHGPQMWSCRLMFLAVIFLRVFKSTVTLHASGSCSEEIKLGSSSKLDTSIISDSTVVDITSDILTRYNQSSH